MKASRSIALVGFAAVACCVWSLGCEADRKQATEAVPLLISESPMSLLSSGVEYSGVANARPRTYDDEKRVMIGDIAYYDAISPAGLIAHNTKTGAAVCYPMFALAIAAGWYERPSGTYLPDDIRGLHAQDGVLWMGSNGVGVLAFDAESRTWSRHDMKDLPVSGHHMGLVHADSDYVFASAGWLEEVPVSKPALHAYSVKRGLWLMIDGIPSTDAISLGSSEGLHVAAGFDYRPFAEEDYVPIGGERAVGLARPSDVTCGEDGSYLLVYDHSSPVTRLLLRRDLLEEAANRAAVKHTQTGPESDTGPA